MYDKFIKWKNSSSAKLRRWVGYNSPSSGTPDEWVDFDYKFKTLAPIRHFFVRRLPNLTWRKLGWRYRDAKSWVRYRIVRYHVVNTGLTPGYYEIETLMLHSNFQLLVDYVEKQAASCSAVRNGKSWRWKQYIPFGQTWSEINFRSRELGLKHLAWECTLDDPLLEDSERSDHQARVAREITDLYLWWTTVRPARVEIPGPVDRFDDIKKYGIMYTMSNKFRLDHPAEYKARKDWMRACQEQEDAWRAEDDANLIRLVKLRRYLWT